MVKEDVVVDDADTVEGGKDEEVDGGDGTDGTDVGAATVVDIEPTGEAVVVVDPVEPHAASTRTRLITTSRFRHNITNHSPPDHHPPPVIS